MAQDPVADFLRQLNTSDRARAAAWDAVYASKDDTDAQARLSSLPFSDDIRAQLWDLRAGGSLTGTVTEPKPAATEDFMDPQAQPEGSAIGRFLSNAGEMLNPVTAIKGIANAITPEALGGVGPVATAKNIVAAQGEQFSKAGQAMGEGRYVEAAGHGMAGALPLIGPAAANAGEQIASGDVAGGLGGGAGLLAGAGLAGPAMRGAGKVVQPLAKKTGEVLYQSALKPTKATLKDVRTPAGAGPDAARQALVQTGLKEGIPVTARGARKVETLIDSLNAEVQQRLDDATNAGKKIDPVLVEQRIQEVAKDFANQINAQPDLKAIDTVRENFMENPAVKGQDGIPVQTAQEMKTNTYKGLRGKYGRELGGTIEAEKAGARGLREGIEQAAPEVAGLNAREGALIPLERAIADAMQRRGNYAIFGLTPLVGAIPAIASGNPLALLASLIDRAPGLVSRGGIWINRTGQRSGKATQAAAKASATGNAASHVEQRRSAPAEPHAEPSGPRERSTTPTGPRSRTRVRPWLEATQEQ
jgi:hypothetical protein